MTDAEVRTHELELGGGATLRWYEAGASAADAELTAMWHHGTPYSGEPPAPLIADAERRAEAGEGPRTRWLGFDRPGYGGSSDAGERSVADVAPLAGRVLDEAGVDAAVMVGHSGGGPHALACAAVLGARVTRVVCAAGLAPRDADGLDWFDGMYAGGLLELGAALKGEASLRDVLEASEFDPRMFTASDMAALAGEWGWLNAIAAAGVAGGLSGFIGDDLAYVNPWGFELADVKAPVLLLHGADDRVVPLAHSRWLAERLPDVELRVVEGAGHISVLGDSRAIPLDTGAH